MALINSIYKFKRNVDIGSLDAENDKFLNFAFVDKNDLPLISDTNNSKAILLGRTGVGKSALIKHLAPPLTVGCVQKQNLHSLSVLLGLRRCNKKSRLGRETLAIARFAVNPSPQPP